MHKVSTVFLAGLASIGLSAGALAQGAGNLNELAAVPELQRGLSVTAAPVLNPPASQLSVGLATPDRSLALAAPQTGLRLAPAGPGSGFSVALDVPADLRIALSPQGVSSGDQSRGGSGGFGTADGQDAPDTVPPMLGIDLSTGGTALVGNPRPNEVKLNQ